MSTFLCGDIQSCFDDFINVFEKANIDLEKDRLILLGDLVNRGPKSLETIDWIYENRHKNLDIVLGNHDIHLIACYEQLRQVKESDTILPILESSKAEQYIEFLCSKAFIIDDENFIAAHAGIYPNIPYSTLLELNDLAKTYLKDKEKDVNS